MMIGVHRWKPSAKRVPQVFVQGLHPSLQQQMGTYIQLFVLRRIQMDCNGKSLKVANVSYGRVADMKIEFHPKAVAMGRCRLYISPGY